MNFIKCLDESNASTWCEEDAGIKPPVCSHLHLSVSSWLCPLCPPGLKPLIYCPTTDVFPAWNESGGNSNPVIFHWSWITATTTPEKQPTGGEKQESSGMLMLLRMCSLSMNKIVQAHKEDQIDLSEFGHWLASNCEKSMLKMPNTS